MIFLRLLFLFGFSIAIELCCERSNAYKLLIDYLRAVSNRNREQLFDTLSEDFKFTNCYGSTQSRQQMLETIQKINVPVAMRQFSIQSDYKTVNNVLQFSIFVINNNQTISKNYYEAKTINGKLRLISEKIESCNGSEPMTTTLLDQNDVGRRIAKQINDAYLNSVKTGNRELLFKTVTDDFKLLSCEQKFLSADELLKPKNLNKIPPLKFPSEIETDFRDGAFNFHIGEPNKHYSVFYTVWDRKDRKYRLKQHMLFDCEMEQQQTNGPKKETDFLRKSQN